MELEIHHLKLKPCIFMYFREFATLKDGSTTILSFWAFVQFQGRVVKKCGWFFGGSPWMLRAKFSSIWCKYFGWPNCRLKKPKKWRLFLGIGTNILPKVHKASFSTPWLGIFLTQQSILCWGCRETLRKLHLLAGAHTEEAWTFLACWWRHVGVRSNNSKVPRSGQPLFGWKLSSTVLLVPWSPQTFAIWLQNITKKYPTHLVKWYEKDVS